MRIRTTGSGMCDRQRASIRFLETINNITLNLRQLNMSFSAKPEMLSFGTFSQR